MAVHMGLKCNSQNNGIRSSKMTALRVTTVIVSTKPQQLLVINMPFYWYFNFRPFENQSQQTHRGLICYIHRLVLSRSSSSQCNCHLKYINTNAQLSQLWLMFERYLVVRNVM